ncbi:MAG TPA: hypothetical protein VNQ79_09125 [Blastocatellia bacterium]|nr:hypothetical protein [Blastocatellia bacterium]
MNKDNILYGIIGLLVGLIIGYLVTDRINTAGTTTTTSAGALSAPSPETTQPGSLPPDHPPTGRTDEPAATGNQPEASGSAAASSAGGVKWNPPSRWKARPSDGMRLVTYLIPAAGGDSEGAECPVFYFGEGGGGGVQANIDRWIGQFKQPDGRDSKEAAKQKTETINGFKVTMVDVTGTFSGGGMTAGGDKAGYRLLGAIVEGPQGPIFFKLIGPARTVAAAQGDFQTLLKSLAKAA